MKILKRAFYIDVGLDDDLEGAVQGFIKDIKSKELSSGHLKNITTILNSVGAFEDYYIPTIDNSRSVEIDTIPGMDTEIDNEFLQYLLKAIINGIGVPYAYIDSSTEVEFARNLTMTNNPFVRFIISAQDEMGTFFTKVFRELYKNEFIVDKEHGNKHKIRIQQGKKRISVSIDVDKIEIRFPTPIDLVLGNTNERVQNAQTMIEFLATYYFPDDPTGQSINPYENELKKAKFKRELAKKQFLSTLDWDRYDEIYDNVLLEFNKDTIENSINFNPEAKKSDDLDALEEDDY